jgi:citrate lyase subunit beta/citryl-CoA lyase
VSLSNSLPPMRSRRSCLLVPGNDPELVHASRGTDVDEVVLDLLPGPARGAVADAVAAGGWSATTLGVRVHDLTTSHTYRDVIEVVETAGTHLDVIVLPKVQEPEQVAWLDLLLLQIERTMGLPEGGVAIEAGIESAMGLTQALAIAQASDRVQALVLGSHGFAADTGMRSPSFDFALQTLRVAATAAGVQAVAGPSGKHVHARAAGLGLDGAWVEDPDHIAVTNEAFGRGGSHAPQVATDQ